MAGSATCTAEGEILVREEHLERVLEILEPDADRDQVRGDPARVRRVIEDVVLLTLGDRNPSHSTRSTQLTSNSARESRPRIMS